MTTKEAMTADDEALLAHLSPAERAAMGVAIEDDPKDTVIVSDVPAAKTEPKDKATSDDAKKSGATDDDAPADKTKTTTDDDDGDDDDDDDDDEPATAAAAEAAATAAETAAATGAEPDLEGIALDLTPVQAQYETKLATLDETKAEKFQAMMDGDLTAAEYAKFEAQYLRDRDALAEEKNGLQGYVERLHAFKLKVATEDGINYAKDAERATAWDNWVKMLANDPKNEAKPEQWFLDEAHRMVKLQFGDAAPAPAAAAGKNATPEAKKVDQKKGRAPNLSTLPPTLAEIPSAADSGAGGDGDGEFAHLYALQAKGGMEYERALARLSPEQRDRFERD